MTHFFSREEDKLYIREEVIAMAMDIKKLKAQMQSFYIEDLTSDHNFAIEELAGECFQLACILEEFEEKVVELEDRITELENGRQ